jgi:hypothetical protein
VADRMRMRCVSESDRSSARSEAEDAAFGPDRERTSLCSLRVHEKRVTAWADRGAGKLARRKLRRSIVVIRAHAPMRWKMISSTNTPAGVVTCSRMMFLSMTS